MGKAHWLVKTGTHMEGSFVPVVMSSPKSQLARGRQLHTQATSESRETLALKAPALLRKISLFSLLKVPRSDNQSLFI